jgi:N6-L-threonylcarbamoyladenine synthase
MRILGIETSCDETAAAVAEASGKEFKILSGVVSSQIKIHKKYGGVVPEVAARKHTEVIFDVIKKSLPASLLQRRGLKGIDLIAVTNGPGLVTSLRVGVLAAQMIATMAKKPLVGVNHIEAHLLSPFLSRHYERSRAERGNLGIASENTPRNDKKIEFPAVGLIVSGGHTELVLIKNFGDYELIGETRDDAVGEAFDKVAKILGLGYPGGPAVAVAAAKFQISNFKFQKNSKLKLPRPMIDSPDFDFSFSGLKTAVLYLTEKLSPAQIKKLTPAIAAEFQQAAIDVLVAKTARAAKKFNAKSVLLGGGVSANKELREQLGAAVKETGAGYFIPKMEFTGDNAAMIAFAGWKKYQRKKKNEVFDLAAEPNLTL